MLEKTIQLVVKALIIGVLINIGLQHVSTNPLPYSKNTAFHNQASDLPPLSSGFQVTNPAEK